MDMSQYQTLFISETREHLQKISELTVRLEAEREDREVMDSLFRSAHSVKGMAASMGFAALAGLAHKMEDLMDRVRHGMAVDTGLFDLLLAGEARLSTMLDQIAAGGSAAVADDLISKIDAYNSAALGKPAVPASGEEVAPLIAAPAEVVAADQVHNRLSGQQTIKVKTTTLDSFLDITGELLTVKHRLAMFARSLHNQELSETVGVLERHIQALHDQVIAARLIPLTTITERFPRMVRDLARKEGKEISFALKGVEIELDRGILELLGDPLSHLLINCVDHGIETPAERIAAGKTASGTVAVSVSRVKEQVEILVEDDGRGIDPEHIAAVAVQKGLVSREKAAGLDDAEKLLLICHPGFSTAARITEISGRGVGMDVVRTTVQSLGGTLNIASQPGKGVSFLLRLPLTIAIINVLLVKVGNFTLAIPLTAITRTIDLWRGEIGLKDNQEVVFLGEEAVPLLHMGRLLNIPSADSTSETVPLVITELKGSKVALQIDKLLGNQDVFVKPLARPLSAIEGLCGATVLGDGEIVFILDILNRLL